MTLFAVYGASGCGRGIMPLLRDQLERERSSGARAVFIDDRPPGGAVNGHEVLSFKAFLECPAQEKAVCLAVADPNLRERIAERCVDAGLRSLSVRAANVITMDDVEIGEGSLLSPFVTLTSNIRIGRFFHANLYSYVEHDCVIGDFVTLGPGVKCNGNVVIEHGAYIGSGAVIRQGRPGAPLVIGRGAVVGMGAVVTKSVPPGVTVVGNPARPLLKEG